MTEMTQAEPAAIAARPGKWKCYPAYKDSGVEWLEKIPEHWEEQRLKFAASFFGGGTPFKENIEYWSGDIPWVSPKDMKANIVDDTEDHITESAIENSSTRLIQLGAVLMVVRSGILRHSIPVAINIRPVALNQDMKAILPKPFLLSEYMAYVIHGHHKALLVEWRKEGTTVESIEHELLINTSFPIPSLLEQQAIVTYLDRETTKINVLIAKKERLIELLQEKRTALISNAVTKGLDSAVPMKVSGIEWLGEIPENWKVGKIGAECTVKARLGWKGLKASEYVDEGYIFLATPNIKEREIDFQNVNYITAGRFFESPEIMLKVGDVLVAKDGSTLGTTNVIRSLPAPATVNSSIAVIRPRESLDSIFLYWFLSSNYTQQVIQRMKDGMGVPHLFQADLRKFVVLIPSIAEQQAIATYLNHETAKIDALISRIREGIEKLKEYSSALISAAVTGKIDVRDEVSSSLLEDKELD